MALKLGKCRLCLKLGDFYSIFTVDNSVQLADMVMECARIKIFEGDGLPDKVCAECIQKLSSAYIFKQQCERADQELRRNYVPPPGSSSTPVPPNRTSSDSVSSIQTEATNQTKPSQASELDSTKRNSRKRSHESLEMASASSKSNEFRPTNSKRVEELKSSNKRPRLTASNYYMDSDYEDNSASQFSGETDSDEPLLRDDFKCKVCGRQFPSAKSLAAHSRIHSGKTNKAKDTFPENVVVTIPKKNIQDATDVEDKISCDKCEKTFKLKIMLKRHQETCGKSPQKTPPNTPPKPIQKELLISLEPIDGIHVKRINCSMCTTTFKTIENLEKHMRVVHAAVLPQIKSEPKTSNGKVSVPCIYCKKPFDDYYVHSEHFSKCPESTNATTFSCPVCKKVTSKKSAYFKHIKDVHFEPRMWALKPDQLEQEQAASQELFECRMCYKQLATEQLLITHLAAHVSNIEEAGDESRPSTIEDSSSIVSDNSGGGPQKCKYCDKSFKYKKSLANHEMKHFELEKTEHSQKQEKSMNEDTEIEAEAKASSSLLNESYREESESSQEEGDGNTCDICEKQFSYRRLLVHHKRTKHNMSSGTKRASVVLKNCLVRCLICDLEMSVGALNDHNKKHIQQNMKPRNLYTCTDCGDKFKSCNALANHIKLVHRLKKLPPKQFEGADLADFCEVVVTKAEPLDEIQSHNGFGEVPEGQEGEPLVNLSGFNCTICGKNMPTLISLKRHVNWHSNVGNNLEKKLECFVCNETFRFQCHYKLHMREHYRDTNLDPKLLTCTICNRKSKHLRAAQAHMNYHKQTRFKNKDYQCSICKRVFQYRKVYLSHMAIHYKRGESQNTIVGDLPPTTADKGVFDGSHTCLHCGKVCDSENSLKHHMSWHKSKTLLFGARHECPICHVMFTNKKRQELHTRTHYEDDNGPFKCTICGKGYTDEDYFRRHVKGHNFDHQSHKDRIARLRKDKVKCPICVRYYPDWVKLIRHLRRTHPESKMVKEDPDAPAPRVFSCKLCAKTFRDERRLRHHEDSHLRKPEFFKCKFCGKKTISLKNHNVHIKGHLTSKQVDNPFKCPQCDETFIKGYDLHHHLRDVHKINETWIADRNEQTLNGPLKEFQCSICLKILASKGNYERHLDYHNSLRCNYCYDYFSSLRFLEGHLTFSCDKKKLVGDTEIYPRKIKCYVCYKPFHLQVKLDCHLRTQHGIKVSKEASKSKKDLVCDYCFRVFENLDALTGHKIYHRTVGYYGCIYCKRKFNTLTLYRKHKNHHFAQLNVDNPTKCEHCDDTFVAFREMIYHMRDVHGDDKEWIIMPKESIEETCPICGKVFFNLHRHLDYHEANRCKKCGEYFYSRTDFDNHLCAIESDDEAAAGVDLDIRPKYEECRFCFKPITRKSSKAKHDVIHKGSGSISCRFCSHKFKTMDAFNIHAFSHRNRKYRKNPLKCRKCGEKFIQYGPFIKHMRGVHKFVQKMHYRATVKAEPCVVCGDEFPNLHNHYRAHLQNQCTSCLKYFTSAKVFAEHECAKEDSDPTKVFTCDANLPLLINTYIPKDEQDEQKYYGYGDDEEEEDSEVRLQGHIIDEESQNSNENEHFRLQCPIISDVLSLYQTQDEAQAPARASLDPDPEVIDLSDDDVGVVDDQAMCPTITIDD
ncbi:zinc finger protein 729-like isoform X1 [Cydia pomonella]|uniref:zinc finger protein 729-like isoform X1 n=2 Tax=Cydia pomonella TaxID=82600 RepID=UPI002ADDFB03|nr:zinc finger protein 729-like isoform X1 [Cydia pomonella]XP_061720665.1 zinc finger protein 729-like isoform X1 [Cydia pomonella]